MLFNKIFSLFVRGFKKIKYWKKYSILNLDSFPSDFCFQLVSENTKVTKVNPEVSLPDVEKEYRFIKDKYTSWAENKFHITIHWEEYFKVIEPYFFLQDKLENFRRNEIALEGFFSFGKAVEVAKSDKFKLSGDYINHIFDKTVFLPEEKGSAKEKQMLLTWYKVYLCTKDNLEKFGLEEDSCGNPVVVWVDGRSISANLCLFSEHLRIVRKYCRISEDRRVFLADIGCGYAGFMKLLKKEFRKSTCLLVDLPQNILLAKYYLRSNFPGCSFCPTSILYDKNRILVEDLINYDFVFLTPDVLERIENKKFIDFVCNMRSFQEMNLNYIRYYFTHLNRLVSGYFYSVNREQAPPRFGGVNFKDWPFGEGWKTVFLKQPARGTYPILHLQYIGKKIS